MPLNWCATNIAPNRNELAAVRVLAESYRPSAKLRTVLAITVMSAHASAIRFLGFGANFASGVTLNKVIASTESHIVGLFKMRLGSKT